MRRMMAKLREGKANKEEREEEEERVKNSSLEFCADAPRRFESGLLYQVLCCIAIHH